MRYLASLLTATFLDRERQRQLAVIGGVALLVVASMNLGGRATEQGLRPALTELAIVPLGLVALLNPGLFLVLLYPLAITYSFYPILLGGHQLSVERLVSVLALAGMFFRGLRHRIYLVPVPRPLAIGGALLLLGPVPSLVAHPTGPAFIDYLSLVQKVGFGYIAFHFLATSGKVAWASRAVIASFTFSALISLFLVIQTGDLGVLRAGSYSSDPSSLQYQVSLLLGYPYLAVFAAVYAYVEVQNSSGGWRRVVWAVVAALLMVSASLTLRRQLVINISVILAGTWWLANAPSRRVVFASAVVLGFLAAFVFLPSAGWQGRLQEPFSVNEDPRLVFLQVAVEVWEQAPIVGAGLHTYADAGFQLDPDKLAGVRVQDTRFSAHNTFALFLAEGGVVAAAGLLAFVAALGYLAYRAGRLRVPGHLGALNRLAPVMFLQIVIFWWFGDDHSFNNIWFFIGLLAAAWHLGQQRSERPLEEDAASTTIVPSPAVARTSVRSRKFRW